MKKALLFIGVAMCTTFAFAQTNNYAKPQKANKLHEENISVNLKEWAMQNADYKSSIFTKVPGDTLHQFHFNSNAEMVGIIYGADGLVTAGMTCGGEALPENGGTHPSQRWHWIPDANSYGPTDATFAATFPRTSGASWGMGQNLANLCEDGGGFMFMSLQELSGAEVPAANSDARNTQRPHAFFQLPAVPSSASDMVIDVAFVQVHAKFYDQSYIDYKLNGQWYAREINVDGVDASINYYSSFRRRYVMPLSLGNESSIELRFRYIGSVRSNAWGYMWGVDDICIISGGYNRWYGDDENYVAGGYGMIPQGMQLPLSWTSGLHNAGMYTNSNINISASHIAQDGTVTNILTVPVDNILPGNAEESHGVAINEQSLLDPTDLSSAGWFYYGNGYMAENPVAGFQYRGLPTNTLNRNRVTVSATADSNLTLEWDTVAYRVVGYSTVDDLAESNTVEGYRWGHDNGIIPAGDAYTYGFTADGQYVTDDGNWNQSGYALTNRYTTGMVIPTDDNGDPWVLRGVELVTAPTLTVDDLDGAKIRPVSYFDYYSEDGVTFYTLDNGVNQVIYTLNGDDVNNFMETGYGVGVEDGYQAVSIFFPMQPELEPNTSYRVGYRLASSCNFAVATTRTSYRIGQNISGGDTTQVFQSYDSSAVTAPWRHQFWPNTYDLTLDDPMGENILWAGYYNDSYPLIRAIVGPREPLETANVNVVCEETDYTIEYNDSVYCGGTVSVPETSGPTFYIIPKGNGGSDELNMVLDSLIVDGVPVELPGYDSDGDDDFVAHDYSIYDTIHNYMGSGEDYYHTNLERYYWTYTFRDIHGNHSIRAHAVIGEWVPTGVDPVAPEVNMVLAPNPATSQVALSINGVSGMVNCSIIDMSGRVIYNNDINAETTSSIDLRNVPAGAYFVRITNDSFSKVEKLIVR